jgi:HSP20 family protein
MANSNQPPLSGRQQGRQQTSGPVRAASAQQGGHANPHAEQQTAWQSPTEQQTSGAVRPHGAWPVSAWHFGGLGGGPLAMMRRISEDMDHLFESFGFGRGLLPSEFGRADLAGFGAEGSASLWAPHIEVYEREGKLVINADLPGVKKEDLNVEITADAVTIRGHRKQERSSSEGGLYRSERSYGSFYRTIALPEGTDTESAGANFRDGVLRIEMNAPRRQARGRVLQIGDSSSSATSLATGSSESPPPGSGAQHRH